MKLEYDYEIDEEAVLAAILKAEKLAWQDNYKQILIPAKRQFVGVLHGCEVWADPLVHAPVLVGVQEIVRRENARLEIK
jgi:hypothetical protein